MKVLDNFIENLYTGEPVQVGQLKVTPVFIREERALPFLEFEEALAQGLVEVTEVSEGGSVPNLFDLHFVVDLTFSAQTRNFIIFNTQPVPSRNRRSDEVCTLVTGCAAWGRRLCSRTETGASRGKGQLHEVRIPDSDARRRSSLYHRLCS